MQAEKATEGSIVTQAAIEALEQAGGDAYKAAAILEQIARNDDAISGALLLPLLHGACYDAVRKACIRDRGYVAKQADSVARSQAASGAERIKSHATHLMAFLLPIGQKRLEDATKQDVEANAVFYQRQADTMAARGRWLQLISQELAGKKKVKNALSEPELFRLWQEAAA